MQPEPDYEVGYKKPPKHSQFRKGQSGNPRGRPLGSKDVATLIDEALDEKVTVTENGQRRRIRKSKAIATQLVNRAVQGDPRVSQLVLRLQADSRRLSEPQRAPEPSAPPRPHVMVVLPDNGRDPELTKVLREAQLEAQQKYHTRKNRERERGGTANENRQKEVA